MNWADQEYAIGRGIAAIRHKKGPELQPFLRALIEYHLPALLAEATGSTFPNVSYDQLADLSCQIPPLPEQQAIATMLGVLDDKIELNRKMNETLEAMAQALFKNWFVDFEPFRDQGMEDSPLGPIPKGWQFATVTQAVDINPPS
jgi:type I restriction enzyme S subunit